MGPLQSWELRGQRDGVLENVGETVSKPIWQEQKFPLEGDQWRPEVKKSGRDNLERKKLCSG